MANPAHKAVLDRGIDAWNQWRTTEQNFYEFEIDLTDMLLNSAQLAGANFTLVDLSRAQLSQADLNHAVLGSANLEQANLSGANLSRANLTMANLTGANLSGANLAGATLSYANLTDADLSGADLSAAIFLNANCRGTHFRDSRVQGAHFGFNDALTAAVIEQLQRQGAIFNENPGDWQQILKDNLQERNASAE